MIQIVTDSMSDIRQEEARREGIKVLPQPVLFGDESFLDGVDLTAEEFYAKLSTAKELPKTSQVPPEAFAETFDEALQAGNSVLCITGSSKLTGMYQGAQIAKDALPKNSPILIVDSLNASLGQQQLIWEACRLREAGVQVEEIALRLTALRGRVMLVGQVESLKHLVMGGRLSSTSARIGATLNLKPMLRLAKGVIEQAGLTRGKRRAQEWFIKQMREEPRDPQFPVILASANASAALQALRGVLEEQNLLGDQVRQVDIGPIVGTHTGEGVLAVSWIKARE